MSRHRVIVQHDDFERRMMELEAQGKLGQKPPGVQQVSETFLRNGPWSGNNELGYKTFLANVFSNAPGNNTVQNVLTLSEWGYPEVWTLTLGIEFSNALPADSPVRGALIQAIIDFGGGGATQTVICDWLNGTSISLPMNAVSVKAVFPNGVQIDGENVAVTARLSRGQISIAPAVVTMAENGVSIPNGATSDPITIPPFVKKVKFTSMVGSAAGIADVYNDLNVYRLREVVAGTTRQAVRGGDFLRGIDGLDVEGPAHVVDISNASGSTILVGVYGELFF